MAAGFSGHWTFVFGLLGNIVSFMVFLAPIPTFYQIYKKKSSDGFQALPYVVALFSSILWIYYAVIKTNTTLLITINAAGFLIETIYIFFFVFYAAKKAKVQTVKLMVLLIICGMGLVGVTQFAIKTTSERVKVIGWVCLIFSLCVFVAPLCIMRHVIQTKSVEHMPFLLSLFLTLSAVMWFFYGLLLKDYNIAIPNVLGFTFGVIQMVLYKMYRNTTKIDEEKLHAEAQKQIIILEEGEKIPEFTEQIIDIVKFSTVLPTTPEKFPAVCEPKSTGFDPRIHQNVAIESKA